MKIFSVSNTVYFKMYYILQIKKIRLKIRFKTGDEIKILILKEKVDEAV